jgi:hypothetical protein
MLTYQQRVTNSASVEVISKGRQSDSSQRYPLNVNTNSHPRSSPLSPNEMSSFSNNTSNHSYYNQVPLSPKDPSNGRRSTSPLSPTIPPSTQPPPKSNHHESTGDWLSDLQKTMGLMEGRSTIKRVERKDLSSPVKDRSPIKKKPAGLDDNADLPSWQVWKWEMMDFFFFSFFYVSFSCSKPASFFCIFSFLFFFCACIRMNLDCIL